MSCKITSLCFYLIYILVALNISFMKCADKDDVDDDDDETSEIVQESLRKRHLDAVLYHTNKTNEEEDARILKRQRQGDKIEAGNHGEHPPAVGKADEGQSATNASPHASELLIKILWAPFDQSYNLLRQTHGPPLSGFQLSVSNLDGTNRYMLGGTDHEDSGEKMKNFMVNLAKRKAESLQVVDSQSSKSSVANRSYENFPMLLLHIYYNAENGKPMHFTKTMLHPSGNQLLICPLTENVPKCRLMELTPENQAALAQRQYKFRSKIRKVYTKKWKKSLTLKRIKCKGQEDEGLNAEFVRDRNEIDYAKGKMCKRNEYELIYWRREWWKRNDKNKKNSMEQMCDEAIHGLNRVNAFMIVEKISGQRRIGEPMEFKCKLVGGELLKLENDKALLDKMLIEEKTYLWLLNDIEKEANDAPRQRLLAAFNDRGKQQLGTKGKEKAGEVPNSTRGKGGRKRLGPQPAEKTSWKRRKIGQNLTLDAMDHAADVGNNSSSNSVGILKLINGRKALQKVIAKKEEEIDNMFMLNNHLEEDNEKLNGKYNQMGRVNATLSDKLRLISEAIKANTDAEELKRNIGGIMDGIAPYILARNSEGVDHVQQQQGQSVAVAAAGASTSGAAETTASVAGANISSSSNSNVDVEKLLAKNRHLHRLNNQQAKQIKKLQDANAQTETESDGLWGKNLALEEDLDEVQKNYDKLKRGLVQIALEIDETPLDGSSMKRMIQQLLGEGKTGTNDDEAGSSHAAKDEGGATGKIEDVDRMDVDDNANVAGGTSTAVQQQQQKEAEIEQAVAEPLTDQPISHSADPMVEEPKDE